MSTTRVLWVFVGQKATNLQTFKAGGLKKILLPGQSLTTCAQLGLESWKIDHFQSLEDPKVEAL